MGRYYKTVTVVKVSFDPSLAAAIRRTSLDSVLANRRSILAGMDGSDEDLEEEIRQLEALQQAKATG